MKWSLACAVAVLALLPGVALGAGPTDPRAGEQEPLRIMRVGAALDVARPPVDVPVLVADTGLDLQHPDIAPRLFSLPAPVPAPGGAGTVQAGASGWDLLGASPVGGPLAPDADPDDPPGGSGHGTAVAGLLGAAWNNGEGGAGVAPNARFVALRTCWDGDQCFQFVQADAIEWAAARGVKVVSFSWLSGPLEDGLRRAIASHPEILFVTIPSGNGGAFDADPEDPQPCNLASDNVLCVSTSAPDDGLDCGAFGLRSVDVAVPTRNSITTTNGGGYGPTGCATSFASPLAAGVATLLFGIDPAATGNDVRAAIVDSARPAAAWQGRSVSGGIADAEAAVRLFQQRRGIAGPTPPPAPPAPVPAPRSPAPPRGPAPRTPRDVTRPGLGARRVAGGLAVTLSEPARVRVVVKRAAPGRRAGGRCQRPRPRNRGGRACVRWVERLVTRPVQLRAGRAVVRLSARRLGAGRFRARVTARDAAGNVSRRSVAFSLGR